MTVHKFPHPERAPRSGSPPPDYELRLVVDGMQGPAPEQKSCRQTAFIAFLAGLVAGLLL